MSLGPFSVLPVPPLAPLSLSALSSTWLSRVLGTNVPPTASIPAGPFRPPQWNRKQLYSLTVVIPSTPAATVSTSGSVAGQTTPGSAGSTTSPGTQGSSTTYFFDAVLRAHHILQSVATKHPIQTGASIVDHVYELPARILLEIGMSDAMQSFKNGQWTGDPSKSVSAFQTLQNLKKLRLPLTLNTRLAQYSSLFVLEVQAVEDYRTRTALRASIAFEQIFVAKTTIKTISARPQATGTTDEGTKSPQPLSPTEQLHLNLLQQVPPPQ